MDLSVWNVNHHEWPSDEENREKLIFLLQYAILAPSGHNTQPWLFRYSNDGLELYADRTRCLPVVDPEDRELIISCGCALHYLCVAARKFDMRAQVSTFPDPSSPDLLARINLAAADPASNDELLSFHAILQRRTNRHPFNERIPPQEVMDQIADTAKEEKAWMQFIVRDDKRRKTAELIAQGDRIQASDKHFRRELSSWVHANRSQHSDGMPGYAFGIGDFASNLGPFILRTFDWGNGQAAKDLQLALGSPVLAVLGSKTDTPESWLHIGQALATVLLKLTTEGLSASFLNQPIEVAKLRPQLQELLDLEGHPQLLLRIGYGPEVQPTPRRGVKEVLY